MASASRSSVELVTGRRARAQSVVRLEDYDDGDRGTITGTESSPYYSEDAEALSSPENYTFGRPIAGGAGLARRAGGRQQREAESEHEREVEIEEDKTDGEMGMSMEMEMEMEMGTGMEMTENALPSSASNSPPHQRRRVQSAVSEIAPSERTLLPPLPQPTAPSPPAPQSIPTRSVASPSGTQYLSANEDVSTAAPSFVTAPPTVEGHTDSSGATPSSWGGLEHYMEGRDWKPV